MKVDLLKKTKLKVDKMLRGYNNYKENSDGTYNINFFVYGTLKKGEYNYKRVVLANDLVPDRIITATINGYSIIVSGENVLKSEHSGSKIPYAVKHEEGHIVGQLFIYKNLSLMKTHKLLKNLDWLEGHPQFYKRTDVDAFVGDKSVKAMFYRYDLKHPIK